MDGGDAAEAAGAGAGRWWGQHAAAASSGSSASTDVMNQLCRVCGEPAAGFHFGAFTCEGCKSFFGRTYNNLGSITECKNNGECVINKKNRTSCKSCRLRKCLMVGMSKSGSRYGRRSNWFKIHCLLQEQQQQQQQQQQHLQLQHGGVAPSREQGQAKGKVLPMWEGLGQPFPSAEKAPQQVDADNNNHVGSPKIGYLEAKARVASPNHHHHHHSMLQVRTTHPSYGEAAAALWAARSTLLPIHPHHGHPMGPSPLASLSVPFLASPFLHGAAFAQPTARSFVIPFAQTQRLQASPGQLTAAATTNTTSASSSCESCSSSPPDTPDAGGRERDSSSGAEDGPTAVLRALGPIQEQPMDLSMRRASCSREATGSPCGDDGGPSPEEAAAAGRRPGRSKDAEDRRPTAVPLDLSVTLQNR